MLASLGAAGCASELDPTAAPLEPHQFALTVIQVEGLTRELRFVLAQSGMVEGHATLISQTDVRRCRGELTEAEWTDLGARAGRARLASHADSSGACMVDAARYQLCVTPTGEAAHCFVYGCPREPAVDELLAFLKSVLARIDAASGCGPDDWPWPG